MEKQYYISHEQYQQLKQAWKTLSDEKAISAADIVIYNMLRSKSASRGFSPATGNKIQGNDPWFHSSGQSILPESSCPGVKESLSTPNEKQKSSLNDLGCNVLKTSRH